MLYQNYSKLLFAATLLDWPRLGSDRRFLYRKNHYSAGRVSINDAQLKVERDKEGSEEEDLQLFTFHLSNFKSC
jgi:hypothetical protein